MCLCSILYVSVCQLTTRGLTLDQMVRVLTEPKHALVKQYRYLFNLEDVNFHITEQALQVGVCVPHSPSPLTDTAHPRASGTSPAIERPVSRSDCL